MRVLVTGHRGYIGSVLTPLLRAAGHDVVGLDNGYFEGCTFGSPPPDEPGLRLDVRDAEPSHLEGFAAVIHLAGLSNDPLGDLDPSLTDDINHRAAVHLARLARAAGVERFLFASSCSNYGAAGDDFLTEEAPLNPVTPYGRSKVDVEAALRPLADDRFSPVYLRASTAYGASPRLRFDLVVNNLTAWAFTTGRVLLKSDGSPWRPVVHVDDIAQAYLAALEAPRDAVHDRAFNVGATTENYRIRELAEIVAAVVPGCRIEYAPGAGPDKRCYRVDCNRIARTLPSFKPQWTARRGVEQLYAAYRRHALGADDFEGPRFQRIAHIRWLMGQGRLTGQLRWSAGAGQP
jgi:nucleoside-diphosphate-sugar epimerase